jgi:hypothetical protein
MARYNVYNSSFRLCPCLNYTIIRSQHSKAGFCVRHQVKRGKRIENLGSLVELAPDVGSQPGLRQNWLPSDIEETFSPGLEPRALFFIVLTFLKFLPGFEA